MSDGSIWYFAQNGEQQGPFSQEYMADLLGDRTIGAQTLVWNPELTNWAVLCETSLGDLIPPELPTPPPLPRSALNRSEYSNKDRNVANTDQFFGTKIEPQGAPNPDSGTTDGQLAGLIDRIGVTGPRQEVPTDADLSIWGYCVRCLTRDYIAFQGRARRLEFWSMWLFNALTGAFFAIIVASLTSDPEGNTALLVANFAVVLILFPPTVAVYFRRLHDLDLPGSLVLIMLIPYVNLVFLIMLGLAPSKLETNRYGPVPAGVLKD